jgi:hypothetical protein
MRLTTARLLIAVSLVGALSVAACLGPSSSNQFRAVLQSPGDRAALPVTLNDETDLVTAIDTEAHDPTFQSQDPTVWTDPSHPNAFVVSWTGGACDNDVLLWFTRHEGGYSLSVEVHGKFSFPGGCPALGIPRDVRIVTSSPVPIDSIVAAGGL